MKHTHKLRKNEGRISQCLGVPLKLNFKYLKRKGILKQVLTQDVSGGGMRVRSQTMFKKGDRERFVFCFCETLLNFILFSRNK